MDISAILIDANGALLTGKASSTALKIRRVADGFLLDWNDLTFKGSAWITPSTLLIEVDSVNFAGFYKKAVTITAWNDGFYQALVHFDDATTVLNYSGEKYVQGGQEVELNLDAKVSLKSTQASVDIIDGLVDSVKATVDTNLDAKVSLKSTQASVDVIDGLVDSVKATVDTNLDAKVSTRVTLGTGNTSKVYTVLDGDGHDLAGVEVEVRAANDVTSPVIAKGTTGDAGTVTFYLNAATTYYLWRRKAGYTFTNPDTEVVP
jgi:hypothetical protein